MKIPTSEMLMFSWTMVFAIGLTTDILPIESSFVTGGMIILHLFVMSIESKPLKSWLIFIIFYYYSCFPLFFLYNYIFFPDHLLIFLS